MTNFEKWKENLKPNNLVGFNPDSYITHWEGTAVFNEYCDENKHICPARKYCRMVVDEKSCKEAFLDWANAEAEEEPDHVDEAMFQHEPVGATSASSPAQSICTSCIWKARCGKNTAEECE